MLVKKIRYTDFLDNVREEEFRFNLSKSELLDMNLTVEGGIVNLLEKWTQAQDVPSLTKFTKEFIKASYGEISPDGRDFMKSDEIWEKFYRSNAYDELYTELLTSDEVASAFINAVIPDTDKKQGDDRNLRAVEKAKAEALAKRAEANEIGIVK